MKPGWKALKGGAGVVSVAVITSGCLALIPGTAHAATDVAAHGTYQWRNLGADLCLTVGGGSADPGNGAAARVGSCDSAQGMNAWTDAPKPGLSAPRWSYTNESTRLCLDTADAGVAAGTAVVQGACTGSVTQAWSPSNAQAGSVRGARSLVQHGSAKCLDTAASGTGSGTPVVLAECTGGPTQTWLPVPVPTTAKLRYSELTGIGSHNTYEKATFPYLANALDAGLRLVEIDAWSSWVGASWPVSHGAPVGGHSDSNCVSAPRSYGQLYSGKVDGGLKSCLENLRLWGDHNPGHDPVLVKVEVKDGFFVKDKAAEFDSVLSAHLGAENILTPSRLLAATGRNTLAEVGEHDAWPYIDDMKGKFIVQVHRGTVDWRVNESSADQMYIDQRLAGPAFHEAMAFPVLSTDGARPGDPRQDRNVMPEQYRAPYYVFFDGPASEAANAGNFYDSGFLLTGTDAHKLGPADARHPTDAQSLDVLRKAVGRHIHIASTDWDDVAHVSRVLRR